MGAAGLLHDPGVACGPRRGDRSARADYAMAGAAWALPGASADRDLDVANLDLRVDNGRDRLPDVLSALRASGGCSPFSETSLEITLKRNKNSSKASVAGRVLRRWLHPNPRVTAVALSCSQRAGIFRKASSTDRHAGSGLAVPRTTVLLITA